jgi:hypothetical protein
VSVGSLSALTGSRSATWDSGSEELTQATKLDFPPPLGPVTATPWEAGAASRLTALDSNLSTEKSSSSGTWRSDNVHGFVLGRKTAPSAHAATAARVIVRW